MSRALSSWVAEIKQKKELKDIANTVVEDALQSYLKKHSILFQEVSPKERKLIIKEVRAQLRLFTGRFQKTQKQREDFLTKGKIKAILQTHASTAERLSSYPFLKNLIKKLSVHSILDLACGLNPFALADSGKVYYAADIHEEEIKIIKKFFEMRHIQGNAFIYDLRKIGDNLPQADLCLLFKVLDIIELKGHSYAQTIIEKVPCKYVLASFATTTLSGKAMRNPRRIWFERLLNAKGHSYKKFSTHNEIFYLIKKSLL